MAGTETVTRDDVDQLIRTLLVDEFDIEEDQITDSATMEDLDLDSLDLVEIGQVVEQKYGVRIKAADAEGVEDLGGVIDMIFKKIQAGPDADADGDAE